MLVSLSLLFCALINIVIGLLHIIIIFFGAPAYKYFGAGEWMVKRSEVNPFFPAMITASIAFVFFVFAMYFLEASELLFIDLPFLKIVLVLITLLYLVRGAAVFFFPFIKRELTNFESASSYASLSIGLLHFFGVFLFLN